MYCLASADGNQPKVRPLGSHFEMDGKALIIALKDISGMKTLTKDKQAIEHLYRMGKENTRAILEFT